jgi:hypothetical protein
MLFNCEFETKIVLSFCFSKTFVIHRKVVYILEVHFLTSEMTYYTLQRQRKINLRIFPPN